MIDGIYNYCNRWCERCAFNTRCAIGVTARSDDPSQDPTRTYYPELEEPIHVWAQYWVGTARQWVAQYEERTDLSPEVDNALAVLSWNSVLGWTKLRRALLSEESGAQSDADGSAKVSRIAYTDIADALDAAAAHFESDPEAAQFARSARRAAQDVDERFPGNRHFHRPGFDQLVHS